MQLARRLMRVSHQRLSHSPPTAAAVQGYKMRDEDLDEAGAIINPDHDGGIRTAVNAWNEDPAAAKARYGPIASWDTSGITNMSYLFYDREDFNEDISRWNVSNVVDMTQMFCGATSFTGDLSCWNVGQVVSMASMFRGATSFTGDLSNWEVGQVEHMASMFSGATSFTGDLSCWNVGQVEYMMYMLEGATSFTHQLGGAWSTSTASKFMMFSNSPGTITGKTKDAHGTIW